MGDNTELLDNPAFQKMLQQRSRWRWGLSVLLIVVYLIWGIAGIYMPEAYAKAFMGTSVPRGMAAGYFIIALSVFMSLVYIRVVNRLEDSGADSWRSKR